MQVISLEHKGRYCEMCECVRLKLGHTTIFLIAMRIDCIPTCCKKIESVFKVIYPRYYQNLKECFTFAAVGQIGPYRHNGKFLQFC